VTEFRRCSSDLLHANDFLVYDLARNPTSKKGVRLCKHLATLTRNSTRWPRERQRLLLGPELFASLGIPTPKVVAQLGLATPGLSSSADAPGDNSGICPWIGPKVLDDLSWNMSRVLTVKKNAMHLKVVGALFCWTWGNVKRASPADLAAAPSMEGPDSIVQPLSPVRVGCRSKNRLITSFD